MATKKKTKVLKANTFATKKRKIARLPLTMSKIILFYPKTYKTSSMKPIFPIKNVNNAKNSKNNKRIKKHRLLVKRNSTIMKSSIEKNNEKPCNLVMDYDNMCDLINEKIRSKTERKDIEQYEQICFLDILVIIYYIIYMDIYYIIFISFYLYIRKKTYKRKKSLLRIGQDMRY